MFKKLVIGLGTSTAATTGFYSTFTSAFFVSIVFLATT